MASFAIPSGSLSMQQRPLRNVLEVGAAAAKSSMNPPRLLPPVLQGWGGQDSSFSPQLISVRVQTLTQYLAKTCILLFIVIFFYQSSVFCCVLM